MAYKGRILARSPYYVTAVANTAPILSAKLLVWVWTGDVTSQPANPNYTIDKLPLKGDDDTITFEISAIVKDFIDNNLSESGGDSNSPRSIWVATQVSMVDSGGIDLQAQDTYIGHLGYGLFTQQANPLPVASDHTLYGTTTGIVAIVTDEVLAGNDPLESSYAADNYDVYVDGAFSVNKVLTITDESKTKVQFIQESSVVGNITKIVYKNGASEIKTSSFLYDECVGTVAFGFLYYTNAQGEKKYIYMGGRKLEGTSVTKDSYISNIGGISGANYTYSRTTPQKKTINQSSKRTITLNTGWIPDSMNRQIQEMMLSREWTLGADRPVYLNTSNIQYKENKEDKLINYTFEFEEANNLINDVY